VQNVALNGYVNIDSHLSEIDFGLADAKSVEHLLHFSDDKLAVLRVSELSLGDDFE
jgi:hypothetical protein